MPNFKRKTKIVATLGPASSSPEVVEEMIKAGMNVARLNFSHGTHEAHSEVVQTVREQSEKLGRHVSIFQDLCGPKVRITEVENGEVFLEDGQTVTLKHSTDSIGSATELFVGIFNPSEVMKTGDKAFLADGRIELNATEVTNQGVACEVKAGGALRSKSGISVPDSKLNLPCLTEKDIADLDWAVKNDIDYVALSFVSTAKDIQILRDELKKRDSKLPIIAKLERATSLDNVTDIVSVADAVMVARGDLGLEVPLERVPIAQKFIIEQANYHGTPVITATQMLQSMVNESRPTRAEVSDVCTAVFDGTDAVMLSEETAIGKHPVKAIEFLDKIVREGERQLHFEDHQPRLKGSDRETVADAICYAASRAAAKVDASAILACTSSGYTARLVAKYRPHQILFGATSNPKTLSRMSLYWGVQPILFKVEEGMDAEEEIIASMRAARDQYDLKPGSRVVVTAGLKANLAGTTTLMEIREIPRTD